jgi:hypothetical protein
MPFVLALQMLLAMASGRKQWGSGYCTGGNMGNVTAQVCSETHDAVTEELISARRLWTAVLLNAVEDWRNGTLRARREAQTFIFDSDEDFAMVCNNAGLDFSDFRVRLLKIGRRVEARVPFSLCFAT